MGVESLDEGTIRQPVAEDDDISPPAHPLAGEEDEPVSGGTHGITEIGVHATDPVEIVPPMVFSKLPVELKECLGVVGQRPVFRPERMVKAATGGDAEALKGIEQGEAWVEGGNPARALLGHPHRVAHGRIGLLPGAQRMNRRKLGRPVVEKSQSNNRRRKK